MIYHYNRSEILSYEDLSDEQKEGWEDESKDETLYVLCDGIALPLSQFFVITGCRWSGIMSCTNTSSYAVVLSKRGDSAIVALIG